MKKFLKRYLENKTKKQLSKNPLFLFRCYELNKKFVVEGKLKEKEFDTLKDAKKYINSVLDIEV